MQGEDASVTAAIFIIAAILEDANLQGRIQRQRTMGPFRFGNSTGNKFKARHAVKKHELRLAYRRPNKAAEPSDDLLRDGNSRGLTVV